MELAGEIDSSINLVPQKVRVREEAKIEEIHESDEEMAANWTRWWQNKILHKKFISRIFFIYMAYIRRLRY